MKRIVLILATVALILSFTAAVYLPGLTGPFVFDDITNIVYVPSLRISDLGFNSLQQAATAVPQQGPLGRPLAYLSFGLNHYFGGLQPYYFKLTNVTIHLLTAVVLFFVTLSLNRRLGNGTTRPPTAIYGALIALAVWALHPIHLTSVLYIVQRMTSLSALFIALGLLGFIFGREQLLAGRSSGYLVIVASLSIFGALATLTKENGVLLFAYAFAIELTCYRFASAPGMARKTYFFLSTLFAVPAVLALFVLVLKFESIAGATAYASRPFDLSERLLTEARAMWFYLRLIAVPDAVALGLYHDDFALSRSIMDPWQTLPAIIGAGALFAFAFVARKFAPALAFGILWFFFGHSIESTILPLELVHEHRNYLPSFGVIFAAVHYVTHPKILNRTKPALIYGFFAVYIALLASATYMRAQHWSSEWDLYTTEVRNHPNSSRAHTMLGILYHDNKIYPAAEYEFSQAVDLNTTSPDPVIRLAQHQFVAKGHIDKKVLDELALRLTTLPLNSVTLWVIDPLINITHKDTEINKELLRMYTTTLKRRDTNIAPTRLATAADSVGLAYTKHRDFGFAADLYSFALRLDPKPKYAIALAEVELERGRITSAKDALAALRGTSLEKDDKDRLERLERRLERASRPR